MSRTRQEPTNNEVLKVVQDIATQVAGLTVQVATQKTELLGALATQKTEILEVIATQKVEILETVEAQQTEILETINAFATDVERRFKTIEKEVSHIKSDMVTKDFLVDKLADTKGDIIVLMRKEDAKLGAVVGLLEDKQIFSRKDATRVRAMEPFPSA